MAFAEADSLAFEPARPRRLCKVAPVHFEAPAGQKHGEAGHPDPADAYHVDSPAAHLGWRFLVKNRYLELDHDVMAEVDGSLVFADFLEHFVKGLIG